MTKEEEWNMMKVRKEYLHGSQTQRLRTYELKAQGASIGPSETPYHRSHPLT